MIIPSVDAVLAREKNALWTIPIAVPQPAVSPRDNGDGTHQHAPDQEAQRRRSQAKLEEQHEHQKEIGLGEERELGDNGAAQSDGEEHDAIGDVPRRVQSESRQAHHLHAFAYACFLF